MTFPKIRHLNMRMTLYFSLVMMTALIFIVIFISQTYSGKLIAEMNMVINQKLNLITSTLNNTLQEIRALQFAIIHDKNINTLMKLENSAGKKLDQKHLEALGQALTPYKQRNTNVTSIFAISKDRKILDPLYSGTAFQWIATNSSDLDALEKSKSLGMFSSPNSFPLTGNTESYKNYNITYYGQFYDSTNYQYLGYIAINLKKNSIFSDISSLCNETFDFSCFIDNKHRIVHIFGDNYSNSFLKIPEILKTKAQIIKIGGNNYLLYSQTIKAYPEWTFIGLVNYQQITSNMFKIYQTVLITSVVVLLLIIFLSFYIASRVTVPIRKLSKSMDHLGKGIWPQELSCHTNDEIKELVNGFNNLVRNIKSLTEKIVEEQEAKKKIEVSMIQFQLDLLQSQINPHFIHNTLNTMNYMAKKAGVKELEETITSFNALLRTSISKNKNFISVMEEVDNLKNYMNIQKHRYDTDMIFDCEVDPKAKYALLPKLILQPLVENALFHGIVPKNGGRIKISIWKEGNELSITVEDDGAGIQENMLNLILQGATLNKKGFTNMGLSNVNERLSLYYSDRSKLQIISIPDQGTKISFHIPFSE